MDDKKKIVFSNEQLTILRTFLKEQETVQRNFTIVNMIKKLLEYAGVKI